jgi:Tol biopolymer transport system component
MRRIVWYLPLTAGAMLALTVSHAQATVAQQAPRATVRELATIDGYVNGFVRLPDGRTLIYSLNDSTYSYNVAMRRRTLLGTDMLPASISPQGDRLAFTRSAEDRSGLRLWTIPIDPQTGAATGRAQLMSQRRIAGPRRPRFSPDGRTLAFFAASSTPTGTWDLVLVPATGGSERVIGNYPRVSSFAWSADGSSIDTEVDGNSRSDIVRIDVASGATQELFTPRSYLTNQFPVGISPDARVAIFTNNPDVFMYRTAAGAEGLVEVPLPALDDAWGYDFSLDSQNRYVTTTYVRQHEVRVLDTRTGRTRAVLAGEASRLPAWAPDGRRLAMVTGHLSHYGIAVVNSDGSGLRRYPMPLNVGGWHMGSNEPWENPWSPDGRYLAFYTRGGPLVGSGPGSLRQIAILNVATGEARVLAASPNGYGAFAWRADSRAIRMIRRGDSPPEARVTASIVEVDLAGTEVVLRDVSTEFRTLTGASVTADRDAIVAVRTPGGIERFLVPMGRGAARMLPDPGAESGMSSTVVGGLTGSRIVLPIGDGSGAYPTLRVVSTLDNSVRTVRAPYGSVNGRVLPDGSRAILTGRAAGDSTHKLYSVSLDDGSQRLLGEIPGGGSGGRLAPSPDGRFVAYALEDRYTSKIHEIDFGAAIQAITRR